MSIRVRTLGGDLTFDTRDELLRAVGESRVQRDDEVELEDGSWTTVGQWNGPKPSSWFVRRHWYLLAAVLAGEAVLFGNYWLMVVTCLLHALWLVTVMKNRPGLVRWRLW